MNATHSAPTWTDGKFDVDFRVPLQGLLRDPIIAVTCVQDPDQDFNLSVRGTSGFFRLVSDLPNAETLSANRNSGMYFYLNGRLVGRTRRPGNMTRIWLGASSRHFNLNWQKGPALQVNSGRQPFALVQQDGDCLTLGLTGDGPRAMIVLWVLAVLRLAAPRHTSACDQDLLAAALKSLKQPRPWLTLAATQEGEGSKQ